MSNRLAHQKSPYLLQHADNPVDWHPWEEEALAEAGATNKPILLSIGYAACHWCHVMAHESFENPEIAAVMNDLFVNIKVDREERPDLDVIYQRALALMGEQGGWPLTMFLTPQGEPFWGGTYFPPTPRFGRPAFPDLLGRIATVYREQAETIATNVSTLRDALGGLSQSTPGGPIGPEIPRRLAEALTEQFDPVNGGIGQAPKFPHVPIYELVLADSLARPGAAQPGTENGPQTDPLAGARAVLFALGRMCQGGIYDHLGGGFARYTTDAAWLVPHFEKMLYDNAQLIDILRLAATASGDALYADRLKQTADWVLREMTVDGGGFAGTLDADSEGEEGRFYVWRAEEIDEILGPDAELFKSVYDVSPEGNFEGKNILNRLNHPDPLDADSEERLAQARERLLAARARRIRPGRDDKVLADWNGLMITALARAARAFHRHDWMDAARRAYGFIMDHMSSGNENRLLAHSHCDGETRETGFLDDYASMARAAVTLYETTGDPAYLHQAAIWLDTLDLDYRDRDGGYFLTAADADLLVRPKVADDGPVPSGNALAAEASARLWLLTGKDSHRRRAEAIIADFSGGLSRNAFSLAALVNVARLMQSAAQVTIIGPPGDPATESLAHVAWTAPRPDLVIQAIAPDDSLPPDHPAHDKLKVDGAAAALAYVCLGPTCSPPQTDPDSLAQFLAAPAPGLNGDPHAGPVS